ncbi:hypothetical protein WR25_03292 [Diploscapter pachys]|uniref:SCP domain-containing protein n=1 Tax=Diploscapter pachys TaxID=2018661 RepID=A0A2A2JQU6_9BILA|nr:hypothetical protein WR25_03292 [Diploscapter pachys]
MHCLTIALFFFCLLALASSALKASPLDVNVPSFNVNSSDVMANRVVGSNGVTCIDKDLEYAINYAVGQYRGNMDGLARYLLNVATRKGGYWLAQANVIARVKQGSDWQSLTNGQLFTNRDQFGCFYHDNVIFAYIVKIL